jgi:hypothetical protein
MTRRTNRWTGATGSDFRIKRDPAKLLGSAVARSTPPLCARNSAIVTIVVSEPITFKSSSSATNDNRSSSNGRWIRLLRSVFWFAGFVALISLVGDFFWNFWDHNLGLRGFTQDLLVQWFTKAVLEGLLFGLLFGFPTWLARENFDRPKRGSR